MARSPVGEKASPKETLKLLEILEYIGNILQPISLRASLKDLPDSVKNDTEKLTRFLLLVATLDQQAKSPTAIQTAKAIYDRFGDELFLSPNTVLNKLNTLSYLTEIYAISPAIGRYIRDHRSADPCQLRGSSNAGGR